MRKAKSRLGAGNFCSLNQAKSKQSNLQESRKKLNSLFHGAVMLHTICFRLAELEAMFSKKFIKGGDQTALSVSSSIDGLQGISRNASGSEQQSEGLQEKRLKRKKQQEEKRRKVTK